MKEPTFSNFSKRNLLAKDFRWSQLNWLRLPECAGIKAQQSLFNICLEETSVLAILKITHVNAIFRETCLFSQKHCTWGAGKAFDLHGACSWSRSARTLCWKNPHQTGISCSVVIHQRTRVFEVEVDLQTRSREANVLALWPESSVERTHLEFSNLGLWWRAHQKHMSVWASKHLSSLFFVTVTYLRCEAHGEGAHGERPGIVEQARNKDRRSFESGESPMLTKFLNGSKAGTGRWEPSYRRLYLGLCCYEFDDLGLAPSVTAQPKAGFSAG